jgi:formylglycine-generating enzyme required for sulfatase activity
LGDPISNNIGMVLVPIPAGEFQMGSRDFFDDEKPPHQVTITKPFYVSVHEVTQRQYETVTEHRPWQGESNVQEGPDYPATYVDWDDAVEFCRKLSQQEGVEYRLPSEAQWEYVCRAGTTTAYGFGDDVSKLGQYAWFSENARKIGEEYAHPVGQKLPNSWGLYDTHGNVWEWCHDWLRPYEKDAVSDPTGPDRGATRVKRGGSFDDAAHAARSGLRSSRTPDHRNHYIGFRVVRTCL